MSDRLEEIKRDLERGGDAAVAELVAEVARLRGLLGRLEWAASTGYDSPQEPEWCCPACYAIKGEPHKAEPPCWLAAALRGET